MWWIKRRVLSVISVHLHTWLFKHSGNKLRWVSKRSLCFMMDGWMDVFPKVKAYRYTSKKKKKKKSGCIVHFYYSCLVFRYTLLKNLEGTLEHRNRTQSVKRRGFQSAWLGSINHLWIRFSYFGANESDRCTGEATRQPLRGVVLQVVAADHCPLLFPPDWFFSSVAFCLCSWHQWQACQF